MVIIFVRYFRFFDLVYLEKFNIVFVLNKFLEMLFILILFFINVLLVNIFESIFFSLFCFIGKLILNEKDLYK